MSTFIGLKSFPKINGKIWLLPKFGDKDVRKFGNENVHEVVGVIGDEFVPKFVPKFEDSPNLGTNLSQNLRTNLVFSQNLGKNSPINEGTN